MKYTKTITLITTLLCFLQGQGLALAQNNPNQYNYLYLTIRNGLCDNSIRTIHKDRNSFMWFGTSNGLDRYDGYELKHYSTAPRQPYQFIESNYINDIDEDDNNYLWVASEAGIMSIDLLHENLNFYKEYSGKNNNVLYSPVQALLVDDFNNLWVGKSDGLAYIILNEERQIKDIRILKKDVNIKTIVKHGSDIWAGGDKCLLHFTPSGKQDYSNIPVVTNLDTSQLIFNRLFSYGDYLWIGTQSGLYCYNTQNQFCILYQHNPNDPHSISSNFITDIDKNSSGDIIIGTRNGVNIYQRNDQFVTFSRGIQTRSLNDNIINRIFVDKNDNIWVGTDFGGINIMAPQRITFNYSLQGYEKGVPNIISTVLEDKEGNILAGIVDGGLAIKRKGADSFSLFKHSPGDPRSLAHNNISDIIQDLHGNYWISTIGGGLDKLDKNNLSHPVFEHYNSLNSSLTSDDIHDIALDSVRNALWICNGSHINTLDFSTGTINRLKFYTQSKEPVHNMNTIFIDSQSRLWIGGNGVYVIDLENSRNTYECIYYQHKLDDPESKINEKITCIFETKKGEIYLGSLGNGIYLLEDNGNNEKYTFKNYAVRCGLSDTSISNILDDENGNLWISTLKGVYFFDINTKRAFKFDEGDGLLVPQFYKRSGCKTINHNMLLGTIDGFVTFSPLVNLPKQKQRTITLTSVVCNGSQLNAQYLLSLVNQLIDLRMIDTQNLTLNYSQFNFSKFLNTTTTDFSSLMKERNISFEKIYRLKSDHIYSDKENLHKILFNLLSNAIKHTPDKGKITLHANQFIDKSNKLMQFISVTNSGSIIAPDEIDKIFNRFYRIPEQNKHTNYGQSSTGIGLHIVKELINLLGGTIKVKSSEKVGVSFRLYFPIALADTAENEIHEEYKEPVPVEDKIEPFIPIDRSKPTLLLVEDNPDMRHYIKNMLKEKYNIAEANNGEQGYKTAQNIVPDFIVSDLMMPVCDGSDFCKRLREDKFLNHIPFLLLTANSSETARIESYENGVDGYITKPFEQSVLLAHIDSILKNRDLRQKKFVEQDLNPILLEVGQPDQQFMNEVMNILEKNYADPQFGVKDLTERLNISYTVIYKKFVSLTGLPPVRFIQLYRLQIAKKILESSTNNVIVSEIAYRVGFNDPKYFTRCFVKQYKQTPSSFSK